MFEPGVVALAVVGALWFTGAIIGGLFKLTFGLLAALFGGMLALLGVGVAVLVVVPFVLFALIPLLLPSLAIVALVWVILRAARPGRTPDAYGRLRRRASLS